MFDLYKLYLKEIFRNKSLIITTFAASILFFPLLYWGLTQFLALKAGYADTLELNVKLNAVERFSDIGDSLKTIHNLNVEKVEKEVNLEENDIYLEVKSKSGMPKYHITMDSTNAVQVELIGKVKRKLNGYFDSKLKNRKEVSSKDIKYYDSYVIKPVNVSDNNELMTKILSILIPMFSIILVLSGVATSTVEVTGSERENKVTETLFVTPLPRRSIFLAKIFATSTFGFLTGLVNFIVMTGIMLQLYKVIFPLMGVKKEFILDIGGYAYISIAFFIIISLLFTTITSSVIYISMASFAKDKKEANMMLSLVSSIMTFSPMILVIPGIEPNVFISMVPVVNIAFALKSIIVSDVNLIYIIEALLFSVIHMFLALKLLLPILEDEDVMFGNKGNTLFKKIGARLKRK